MSDLVLPVPEEPQASHGPEGPIFIHDRDHLQHENRVSA